MTWQRRWQWLFYGGLTLLLLLIVPGLLDMVVPAGVASRLAYNSEGYFFALGLAAWIQFALPRIPQGRRILWALICGAVWAAIGVGLLMSDLPSRVVTLNESAFALAILVPYVTLRRPLPRWVLWAVPALVGLTIWAIGWAPQSWVIDQAETFGFVVLAMITFDIADRRLLDPTGEVNPRLRIAWYLFMCLEPIVVSLLGTDRRAGAGPISLALEYLGRIHESFVGVLLVALVLHLTANHKGEAFAGPSVGDAGAGR